MNTPLPPPLPAGSSIDPFPLHSLQVAQSPAAKEHARITDTLLGFEIESVEEFVRAHRFEEDLAKFETWAHISPQVFLTSYWELRYWMNRIQPLPHYRVADLGAGYGRLGWILDRYFPEVSFVGVECVFERVVEAQRVMRRHQLTNARMAWGDLTDDAFAMPIAELYFLYDCGTAEAVKNVMDRLDRVAPVGAKLLARGQRARESAHSSPHWVPQSGAHVYIGAAENTTGDEADLIHSSPVAQAELFSKIC